MGWNKKKLKIQMTKFKVNLNNIPRLFLLFLLIYILFHTFRVFSHSLFFKRPDRLNMIFYGERPVFLSFGFSDNVNYIGFFNNDHQLYLPGGAGRYRIGALGRFVDIEKKPIIYQKTFSSSLSLYVNYYFFSKVNKIYRDVGDEDFFLPKLGPLDLFHLSDRRSNAEFLDRLYLFFFLLNKNRQDFSYISMRSVDKQKTDTIFLENIFGKKYKGYFYQRSLREEGKTIQILYKSYRSALIMTRILEGEGIRVVDLTENDDPMAGCQVIDGGERPSKSALFLQQIFHCRLITASTSSSDIIIKVDDKLSKDWE